MARKIFKYIISPSTLEIEAPRSARFLSVEEQHGQIVLYALVDDGVPPQRYSVDIIGTGHLVPNELDSGNFVGTVKLHNGDLMFHVFAS